MKTPSDEQSVILETTFRILRPNISSKIINPFQNDVVLYIRQADNIMFYSP